MTDTDRIEYESPDEERHEALEEWDEYSDDDFGIDDVEFFDWLNDDA